MKIHVSVYIMLYYQRDRSASWHRIQFIAGHRLWGHHYDEGRRLSGVYSGWRVCVLRRPSTRLKVPHGGWFSINRFRLVRVLILPGLIVRMGFPIDMSDCCQCISAEDSNSTDPLFLVNSALAME